MNRKWVIVTGGVLSGLGKGTASASLARLIKGNHKIVTIKCDGYLNVDPGTMNPMEHGEVFVLDDGGEVDMDFGHYERILNINCKSSWNLTSGKILKSIIEKERRGDFLGKTIQIFPHVIDEIKSNFLNIAESEAAEIVIIEIGGTVGDIENSWFIEAARQMKAIAGSSNIVYVHLTYVPFLHNTGEPKTKPAQRDIALLRSLGITPNIIIARSKDPLSGKIKEKLALFCDVDVKNIISGYDVSNIYQIPLIFKNEGVLQILNQQLNLNEEGNLEEWEILASRIDNPKSEFEIAICGKYTELKDSYASIIEALKHAGAHFNCRANIRWVETTDIEEGKISVEKALENIKGVIVPGGFGKRGIKGKISVIKYCREHNIPFLGLCYGLQLAIVEFARNLCKLNGANTTEVDERTQHPVINILPEQKKTSEKGATMRLGSYQAIAKKGTKVYALYGGAEIRERHRHRYEVNPEYHDLLQKHGMVFSAMSEDNRLVEFIELPNHKFFIGTQAHPELKSRLEHPAPLFLGFVKACLE